jgi:GAF domain-containing protein
VRPAPLTVNGVPVGVLSAPLLVDGEALGALSVLSWDEPSRERREFLARLAEVTAARLPAARRERRGATPWWQEPFGVRGQVMRQLNVGTWSLDVKTGLLDVDGVAEDVLRVAGLDPERWDHRVATWRARIHPEDHAWVTEAIEDALATGRPSAVEFRVVDTEGKVSWVELRATVEHDQGGSAVRMVGTIWNVTERRSRLEWLAGLFELHPDPIYVLSADDRVEWVNEAARELGTAEGTWLTDRALRPVERVEQQGAAGTDSGEEGEPAEGAGETPTGLHTLLDRARAEPGCAVTGELELRGHDLRERAEYLVRAVEVEGFVATQMADITEQRDAERAAAERSVRVTELNEALVRALNTDDVVAAIAEHVLPLVEADGLIVHDLTGPRPRLLGEMGHPEGFLTQLRAHAQPELRGTAPEDTQARLSASPPVESSRSWPVLSPLTDGESTGAWVVLPLVVGDRRVGSCVFGWKVPRRFTEDDTSLLGTVGVIIAQALANARLYEEARHRAQRLQKELLPGDLPETTAIDAVARYRAADDREVGGDWYDVIPLPGGRTLAVIGDVMGHGLEQAISMGIIRQSALTVAALDLPVDEVMAHLDDVVSRLAARTHVPAVSATCLLALYDPTTGSLHVASAGHPAPIAMRPGGKPRLLDIPAGPSLGLAQVPAPVTETVLAEDTVLVLYTDGLLGTRAPDPSELVEQIARYAAAAPMPSERAAHRDWLDHLCRAITAKLPPDPTRHDDAALLTLATGRVPEDDVAAWDLPWAPESAGRARDLVTERLGAWHLEELAETATLIISELMGNTVRHAVGIAPHEPESPIAPGASRPTDGSPSSEPDLDTLAELGGFGDLGELGGDADLSAEGTRKHGGVIRLRLLHLGTSLVCEVYDGSQAIPRVRHPLLDDEFGRGLQLVAMMADRWGTRYTEQGKCIWARLDSASPAEAN